MLKFADLPGTILREANLKDAYLREANLEGALLLNSNLEGAYLRQANLKNIKRWEKIESLKYANLYDVKNPPDGFIEWAINEKGAVSIKSYSKWEAVKQDILLYEDWKKEWNRDKQGKSSNGSTHSHEDWEVELKSMNPDNA